MTYLLKSKHSYLETLWRSFCRKKLAEPDANTIFGHRGENSFKTAFASIDEVSYISVWRGLVAALLAKPVDGSNNLSLDMIFCGSDLAIDTFSSLFLSGGQCLSSKLLQTGKENGLPILNESGGQLEVYHQSEGVVRKPFKE